MLHLALHCLVPALVAVLWFRTRWKVAFGVMMATMAVDLDHWLANPIYDPNRCSIGFHPLHEPWLFLPYLALCLWPKTKFVGLGLVIHMALDGLDCQFTSGVWMY